mmetsp:Transcript_51481/g.111792  ORF Transcript_51481/g.111792 Transcript_51481/m.111792 type:complete len:221 (+) Transcript_51481:583-1245(+)
MLTARVEEKAPKEGKTAIPAAQWAAAATLAEVSVTPKAGNGPTRRGIMDRPGGKHLGGMKVGRRTLGPRVPTAEAPTPTAPTTPATTPATAAAPSGRVRVEVTTTITTAITTPITTITITTMETTAAARKRTTAPPSIKMEATRPPPHPRRRAARCRLPSEASDGVPTLVRKISSQRKFSEKCNMRGLSGRSVGSVLSWSAFRKGKSTHFSMGADQSPRS